MVPNSHQFGPPTDIPHRHHWKEEEAPHLHIGDTRIKLERLRSTRFIHCDQTIMVRHAKTLNKAKGLISLLAHIKYY
jgi:hypothetical protein